MTEYQPGVCNIGRTEQRKRRNMGLASFAAAVAYLAVFLWLDLPDPYLLGVFAPVFGGFIGILQDHFRFCAGFAAIARYDLAGSGDDAGSVTDADAVRRDRKRAFQIVAYAALAAVVVTAVVYVAVTAI